VSRLAKYAFWKRKLVAAAYDACQPESYDQEGPGAISKTARKCRLGDERGHGDISNPRLKYTATFPKVLIDDSDTGFRSSRIEEKDGKRLIRTFIGKVPRSQSTRPDVERTIERWWELNRRAVPEAGGMIAKTISLNQVRTDSRKRMHAPATQRAVTANDAAEMFMKAKGGGVFPRSFVSSLIIAQRFLHLIGFRQQQRGSYRGPKLSILHESFSPTTFDNI